MKIFKICFIIIFFVLMVLPIAFLDTEKNKVSEIDNSKLPEYTNFKYREQFEEYISKRLGFRNEIINAFIEINDHLFNEMVHPTYKYGQEGYVFFKTQREHHDDSYLNTFANMVKQIQDYTTDRGSYFLFVINPTKISIYRQYLPAGYNFTDYRINYLKTKLDELNVNYIDNTELLMEKSKTEQVYNIKYDAGHWNETGAFYAINNIYKKLRDDGIDVDMLKLEEYTITTEKKDTLPVSHFPIDEDVPLYTLNTINYKKVSKYTDKIALDKDHKYYLNHQNSEVKNYEVLFFRGSYMTGKEKFFSTRFEDIYYIHNYQNVINFDYYYNIVKPDIVLFEAVEYSMNDKYYSESAMKQKICNEPYSKFENIELSAFADINETEIINTINSNIESNEPLTQITLPKGICKYAYLNVDGNLYDFIHNKSGDYIVLDTEILKNNFKIFLISEDMQNKQICNIEINKGD